MRSIFSDIYSEEKDIKILQGFRISKAQPSADELFFFPASAVSARAALSFRFCVTSQLYTRAVATSNVLWDLWPVSIDEVVLKGRGKGERHGGWCSHTVICSLKKSRSSSQFRRFCFADESLDSSSDSASGIG